MLSHKFIRRNKSVIGAESIISCDFLEEDNSSTNLSVGNITASTVDVLIRANDNLIEPDEQLEYYQTEDNVEKKIGIFNITALTSETKSTYKLKAYDNVGKLEKNFSDWLRENQNLFPLTLEELVIFACQYCNLTFSSSGFLHSDKLVEAFYADNITCRQILSYAAAIAGTNVKADSDGSIIFSWYTSNDHVVISCLESHPSVPAETKYIKYFADSLKYEKYSTDTIQRVQINRDENDIGIIYPKDAEGNCFTITGNILLWQMSDTDVEDVAKSLFQKLCSVNYTPARVSVPKTNAIRSGEIVKIIDTLGNEIKTYVMRVNITSSGTSIESTGDKQYGSNVAVASEKFSNLIGKVLRISKSVDGLIIKNEDLEGKYASVSIDVDNISTEISKQTQELDDIRTSITTVQQTSENITIQVQKIVDDGVTKVNTGLGLTIDETCVNIHRDGSEMSNSLDEKGMYVIRSKGTDNETTMLQADADGVEATNLTAKNFLIIGHARFEAYEDGVGCFYV